MRYRTAAAAIAVVALAFQLPVSQTQAADAYAMKVIGFSPDGNHFAFMQFAQQWDAARFQADIVVIDAGRDRFVPGTPLRHGAAMKDDATEDNVGPDFKTFLARAEKRAAGTLEKLKISRPGTVLARDANARADELGSGSDKPSGLGGKSVTAKHPRLGDLKLTLQTKDMPWPKTSRIGSHKTSEPCATAVEPRTGTGYRLTLEQGGRSHVLNDDKTIPASRFCVLDYGIVELRAFDRPDGKVTLAAILGMSIRGFEGEDRVFLAVTRILER